MSQPVKNNSHATQLHLILFCSLHAVMSSVIYYSTHAQKNVIYLLNINMWEVAKDTRKRAETGLHPIGSLTNHYMRITCKPQNNG